MTGIPGRRVTILLAAAIALTAPILQAQEKPPVKMKASAIQVTMIESNEIKLPAEFQVSLYEDLIQQLQKKGGFHVYREGDRNSENAADLVTLHSTVRGFKEGSEELRQVTTVAGATSIKRPLRVYRQGREDLAGAGYKGQRAILWREPESDV